MPPPSFDSILLTPARIFGQGTRIQIGCPDTPALKVDGTREREPLFLTVTAMDVKNSGNKLLAARRGVNCRAMEVHVLCPWETTRRLYPDCLFADSNRFLHAKAMTVAPVIIAVAIVRTILSIAVAAIYWRWGASVIVNHASRARAALVPRIPENVERVALGTIVLVFDFDQGNASVSRIPYQGLTSPPVHSRKAEILWTRGHRASALEPPPLGRPLELWHLRQPSSIAHPLAGNLS